MHEESNVLLSKTFAYLQEVQRENFRFLESLHAGFWSKNWTCFRTKFHFSSSCDLMTMYRDLYGLSMSNWNQKQSPILISHRILWRVSPSHLWNRQQTQCSYPWDGEPRTVIEVPQRNEKVMAWCDMQKTKIIGPFFFRQSSVDAAVYKSMLRYFAMYYIE